MARISLIALTTLFWLGCGGADFRNGYRPGDIETTSTAKVYHLADGVFIVERKSEESAYYLVESTVADYQLTSRGLDIDLEGENAGTYSTAAAPEGYVAAWITEVSGEGPGVTRFEINDATLEELLQNFTAATTVSEIYDLKQPAPAPDAPAN